MSAREVCILVSTSGAILWSDAGPSALALPDTRERWEAIWRNRDDLGWIVHSHPVGPRAFSYEDVTTMDALDAALGRPMRYAVLAPDGLVVREGAQTGESNERPWWCELLRLASGF
ncbi:MAG: hypothetical protein QM723_38355 [Myxococcaceae bacterium]